MVSKPPACGSIEGSNTEHEKSGTKATDATLSRAKLDTIKDTEAISTDCPGTNPIAYDAVKIPRKPTVYDPVPPWAQHTHYKAHDCLRCKKPLQSIVKSLI